MVAPSTNVVKGGVLIGSIANLGSGSGGIFIGTNLNQSSTLPIDKIFEKNHPIWCLLV
jgi:hypothetical protein